MKSWQQKSLLICDIAIVLLAVGAWVAMMVGMESGNLAARGLWSLRYFTVLSNLFMALTSLICIPYGIQVLTGRKDRMPGWALLLRFVGVCAVTLTFLVVMCFLGPVYGFANMFAGPNLMLHLITPLLAILSLIVLRLARGIRFRGMLTGLIPVTAYAIFYVSNILINGIGEGMATNDWYGFLQGDISRAPIVVAIMVVGAFLIALVLWLAGGGRRKRWHP